LIPQHITADSSERIATLAFVGLGGNVGDSAAILQAATHRLMTVPRSRFLRASRFYRTPAWGLHDQADFINAVVALETALPPRALLDELLGIERDFGRMRDDRSGRWGPRILDLDILLFGSDVIDKPGLRVPHPFLHERAFALVPLLDLVDDIEIPGYGSARRALSQTERAGIEPLAER
jgi:2-amino-4-hydroxy-6-hydroxymethyldihydropteridine diphosphokinase